MAYFGSAGERCMAVSVAIAVGNIADDLVSKLNNKVQNLKLHHGPIKNLIWAH